MKLLNLKNIKTAKDINEVDWKKYLDSHHDNWVRHIKYPIEQKEFDRIYKLSKDPESKVLLQDYYGELYIAVK